VDPALLERTRRWLLAQQGADGSFSAADPTTTAYVTWSLIESGYRGEAVDRSLAWLEGHLDPDPYLQALYANCLVVHRPDHSGTVLDRLAGRAVRDGDQAHWPAGLSILDQTSPVESTALAVLALHRGKRRSDLVADGLRYLADARSAQGDWGTTQATILALKALTEASTPVDPPVGTVTVLVDGKPAGEVVLDGDPVLRILSLSSVALPGQHRVELEPRGDVTAVTYQLSAGWWTVRPPVETSPFRLRVDYDRTRLAAGDLVTATVRLASSASSPMVMLDVGIPPGFSLLTTDLDRLRSQGRLERYELTPRQVLVYLRELPAGDTSLSYRLKARFPLRAQGPGSAAYEYYNPTARAEAPGTEFVVR
ncbi:MAG: hypothetical protein AB1758_32675, partial [Candidatus Eremiobacterota bacterium]